jgi:excisionase family DNA binding protein
MIKNNNNYLTSAEVAQTLGVTHDYVRKLIAKGKIKAEKLGRNWIVNKKNLRNVRRQRFPPTTKESGQNGSCE